MKMGFIGYVTHLMWYINISCGDLVVTIIQSDSEDENEDDFDYDENHHYNYKSFMAASN